MVLVKISLIDLIVEDWSESFWVLFQVSPSNSWHLANPMHTYFGLIRPIVPNGSGHGNTKEAMPPSILDALRLSQMSGSKCFFIDTGHAYNFISIISNKNVMNAI